MNILYLSHSDLFSKQANIIHVLHMCSAFSRQGHNVKLFIWKNKNYKSNKDYNYILKSFGIYENFEIHCYPTILPFGNSFISSLFLSNKINFNNIDFIIGRNLRSIFLSSFKKLPIFYETHQPFENYNFFDRILFKILINKKNFLSIITISNYLINNYKKKFDNANKMLLRDASNLNNKVTPINKYKSPSVGYIGSIYEGRGIDIIIKLSQILKNIDFHIIGGEEKIIKKIKNNHNYNNLIFHGYLNYRESIIKMKEFDILIAPYQTNTKVPGGSNTSKWMSPIKLFEYMSAKKPIITSNLVSLKEFMIDKHNCLIVNEESIDQWKNAIIDLLKNKSLYNKIVDNAFNDLKSKYTWDIRVKKIIEYYEMCL